MAVPNQSYPAGGTWFDTLKKSFADVPIDANNGNAIPTTEFLEASESLTTLFGVLPLTSDTSPSLRLNRRARVCRLHARQERHDWQYKGLSFLDELWQTIDSSRKSVTDNSHRQATVRHYNPSFAPN